MKKTLLYILIILLITVFTGCKKEEKPKIEGGLNTTIVIYFSVNDETERIAKTIAKDLHCGIFQIEPLDPYLDEDLNPKDPNTRLYDDMHNPNKCPNIKQLTPLLQVYETVILGYPIWNGSAPCYFNSYMKVADFPKNMKVIPFAVSDTEEIGNTAKDIFKKRYKVKLEKGTTFKSNVSDTEVKDWVKSQNL